MSQPFRHLINDAPEAQAFLKRVANTPTNASLDAALAASIKDESALRVFYATDRHHARLANPYVGLLSLYDVPASSGIHKTRARVVKDDADLSAHHLFPLSEEKRRKTGTPAMAESLADFQKNWAIFTEGALSQLTDWNNVIAAGGSVLGCLLPLSDADKESKRTIRKYYHSSAYPTSDVDLFLWGLNAEQAEAKINTIYEAVRDSIPWEVTCVRTKHAISIYSQYPYRSIQIVLRLYHSPAEILAGFDVDAPCVAYDGSRILANPRSIVALMRQANTVDMSRRSPSYEVRLAKYASRGFEVYVPDLRRADVDPTIFERSINRITGLARLLVLERLSKPEARVSYLESRRRLRSRPEVNSYGRRTRQNRQRQYKGDLKAREEIGGIEMNDYDVASLHIPYGPGWTARRIDKLVYQTDLGMNSTFNPKNKDRRLHRHPAFFGTITECIEDQCGYCPEAVSEEEIALQEEEDKNYIRGRIQFIVEDPGRQVMTGSFNPIDVGEWSELAYLGPTEKLFAAIAAHDRAAVLSLIKAGEGAADVNRRDHVGRTPLQIAIMCKATDIASDLVDAGARMTARLVDGRTALHLAAQLDMPVLVQKLLAMSAINAEKAKEEEEAKAAAQASKAETSGAEETDEERPSSDDDWSSDEEGETKAAKKVVSVVKEQDNQPASDDADIPDDNVELPDVFDLNVLDWDSAFSPLAYAIVSGSVEVVQLLLAAGADPKLASKVPDSQIIIHPLSLAFLSLSESKASTIIDILLRAGASSAQADENLFSIFHAAVCSGKKHIVEKLLQADPHSKAAINVPAFTNNRRAQFPVVSAVANGHYAVVAMLLAYGAKVSFTPEDLDKGRNMISKPNYFGYRHTNQTPHPLDYLQEIQLPIETSIAKQNYMPHLLVAAGAQVSVPLQQSHQSSRYDKDACQALVDYCEKELKKLEKELESTAPPKETEVAAYPENPKTWSEQRRYIQGKVIECRRPKGEDKPDEFLEKKKKQILLAQSYIEEVLKLLRAHKAKTWAELYPERSGDDNGNTRHRHLARADTVTVPEAKEERQQYMKINPSHSYNVELVLPHQLDLYDALFDACWTGDNERIQELCLPRKPKADQSPLQITVKTVAFQTHRNFNPYFTEGSYTTLAVAIIARKWETARLILAIATAQYKPKESEEENTNFEKNFSLNEDDSDSEDSDEDGMDYEDSAPSKDMNFVDLANRQSMFQCQVSPSDLLSHNVSERMSHDGTKQVMTGGIYNQACEDGDLEAFVNVCDLYKSLPKSEEPSPTSLHSILLHDNPELLDEFLRRTGAGIVLDDIHVSKSDTEESDHHDGKLYLGLTVKGKKRKDLATRGDTQSGGFVQANRIPLLWHAVKANALKITEYLIGSGPLAAYTYYAKTSKSGAAERLRKVHDLDRQLPLLLGLVPNIRRESALTAAIVGSPQMHVLGVTKRLFAMQPNRVKDYMQASILFNDMTPLHLAAYVNVEPVYLDFLLANGAQIDAVNKEGYNIYHIVCKNGNKDLLKYLLEKIPVDVSSRLLTQVTKTNDNTPLMIAVKNNNIQIVKLLLQSNLDAVKETLLTRDAKGSMPLHVAVRNGCAKLTSLLIEAGRGDALYAENGVGETPLETSATQWLLNVTRGGYPGTLPQTNDLSVHRYGNGNYQIIRATNEEIMADMRKVEDVKVSLEQNGKFFANAKLKNTLDSFIVFLARKATDPSLAPEKHADEEVYYDICDRRETWKVVSSSVFASPGHRQLVHITDVQKSVKNSLEKAVAKKVNPYENTYYRRKDKDEEIPEEKSDEEKAEAQQWEGVLSWSSQLRYDQDLE